VSSVPVVFAAPRSQKPVPRGTEPAKCWQPRVKPAVDTLSLHIGARPPPRSADSIALQLSTNRGPSTQNAEPAGARALPAQPLPPRATIAPGPAGPRPAAGIPCASPALQPCVVGRIACAGRRRRRCAASELEQRRQCRRRQQCPAGRCCRKPGRCERRNGSPHSAASSQDSRAGCGESCRARRVATTAGCEFRPRRAPACAPASSARMPRGIMVAPCSSSGVYLYVHVHVCVCVRVCAFMCAGVHVCTCRVWKE